MEKDESAEKEISRRGFVRNAFTATGATLLVPGLLAGCQIGKDTSAHLNENGVLDEALKMMSDIAPLTNHGPMAAEALVSVGRSDQVIPFVESYRRRFSSRYPPKYESVTNDNWKEALSDEKRTSDWIEFFNRELKEDDWKNVTEKWSERLAPGLSAAAAHGIIRTGHAVRSLSRVENDVRKREFAEALGYWAAYYQVLPEAKNAKPNKLALAQALQKIPILPAEKRASRSIVAQLRSLDGFAEFGETIDLLDISGNAEKNLSALTEAFADIYARRVSPGNNVALIHAVTGLASVRSLVPYLSKPTTEKMLRYGWQVAAGIYSVSGNETNNQISKAKINIEDLVEQAVTSKEEHAIKFTEACVREYNLNSNPIYLHAANDALGRLRRNS